MKQLIFFPLKLNYYDIIRTRESPRFKGGLSETLRTKVLMYSLRITPL